MQFDEVYDLLLSTVPFSGIFITSNMTHTKTDRPTCQLPMEKETIT